MSAYKTIRDSGFKDVYRKISSVVLPTRTDSQLRCRMAKLRAGGAKGRDDVYKVRIWNVTKMNDLI